MFKEGSIVNTEFKGRYGKYKITGKLAHGGIGIVFLAEKVPDGEQCIIKALRPEISQFKRGDKLIELFSREINILKDSDHPNMVKYIDDFEEEEEYLDPQGNEKRRKVLFLAMEFIKGGDLSEADVPVDEGKVVDWLITICDVLDHNHQHEIYHRDIKPKNIMIDNSTKKIFVIDYGIAKNNDSKDTTFPIFSPHFASPEQLRGEIIDHRTDIYSLGATAYWLLVGKYYYDTIKQNDPRCDARDDEICTDLTIKSINPHLNSIISTALKEDRNSRFWHILDMKLKLESLRDPTLKEWPERSAKLINTFTGEEIWIKRAVTQQGRKNPKCYNDILIEDSTRDPSFKDGKYYNDMYISKQHARIVMKKKRYYLQDTYSVNGTYLNDERLVGTELKELCDGDHIKLGPLALNNTGSFTFILGDAIGA